MFLKPGPVSTTLMIKSSKPLRLHTFIHGGGDPGGLVHSGILSGELHQPLPEGPVRIPDEAAGDRLAVGAGDIPEAAVLLGCVVDGEPEAGQVERIVAQEGAVLVGSHWNDDNFRVSPVSRRTIVWRLNEVRENYA